MFKVVADQLKISEGWVRCGHCADVFDATLYLQPWSPPEEAPASADASGEHEPDTDTDTSTADAVGQIDIDIDIELDEPAAPAALIEVVDAVVEPDEVAPTAEVSAIEVVPADPELEPEPDLAPESEPEPEPEPEPQQTPPPAVEQDPIAAQPPEDSGWDMMQIEQHALETLPPPDHLADAPPHEEAEESDFHRELERFAAGLGRLNATRSGAVLNEAAPVDMAGMPSAPAPDETDDPHFVDSHAPALEPLEALDDEPGFVRQARRQAFWQSTGMRVGMSLLALVLAVLLAAQWALHERDRLAAWQPRLQPLLAQACEHLGCKLAPVRRIDAIVIDSSALVRLLGNLYSFDFVLKNTAATPLAVPALELSLTDASGAVISRRVFLPEEWPNAPALLPAQGAASVNFRLSLALGDNSPMAGYHAVLFYP